MSDLWRRIVALSDPQLTADFQRICGIKSLQHTEQNGIGTSKNNVHKSSNANGFAEECRESHNTKTNGDAHQVRNGSVPWQNGSAVLYDSSLKKRNGSKNGYTIHDAAQDEERKAPHLQNGSACQCQHDSPKPRINGFIHNGETPKVGSDDTTKNSKQNSTYVIENKLLYYIFSFGASLGNEVFYIVFFSFGLWTFDNFVSRKISLIWCVIMYLGQAAKDLICWPRPTSPPVVRLEGRYELEYGMPSTHAMVGVVIPFGMLYYTHGYYEYNLALGLIVAVIWCILVSFSRLYLGMHSVLDILVGIVSAFIIMLCCIPFVDMVDCLLIAHPWCFPALNIVGLGLCLSYPELKMWSTARGDTTQVMAVFSGIYQGLWYMGQTTSPQMAEAAARSAHTGWAGLCAAVGCQLIGIVVLVALLESLKKGVIYVTSTFLGMDPRDPTSKQHLGVELPYKYIGYFTTSFCAGYVMPALFHYLGWHRRDFLNEIHNHTHHFGL